ncbi:amine oxidase [Cutaneotrichosporon oleaginosum]|uniref:Amine oxidase n=1 Tax=Cutaneotrichosporon oleaginosum TaxID=879819 RepID=A0A0J0XU63_9TREE|nr:amine oxidase [Cutaneotrichosporon oleaginosum]KLT44605.1 amine oxidase [Cutaneotrichosporon oleaginosum]TXT13880.1 hypothetical protein COLE_00073 [Cutaneotrichosporon oleaginosum]
MLPLSLLYFLAAAAASDVRHTQVVILGGGISGISLARTLTAHNITDFVLLEARDELGGRAHTATLRGSAGDVVVEKGCNWIQGPGKEPIVALAKKWGLKTTPTNYSSAVWFEGLGVEADGERGRFLAPEETDAFMLDYDDFIENAPGYSEWRSNNSLVDVSVRVATSIMDWMPVTPLQRAYEYWNIDYTFAQSPEESSFANAFAQEAGIANERDDFVVDPRGFKYIFVQEAREMFGQKLTDERLRLNTTVHTIDYSALGNGRDTGGKDKDKGKGKGGDKDGRREEHKREDKTAGTTKPDRPEILVHTDKGTFAAPHVVSTFSVGVLQHQDVKWVPRLPDWKKEAIFTFAMATYQKIFFLFEKQFWGDSEFIMYSDPDERGRYMVWQNINAPGYFPPGANNVLMVTATGAFGRRNEQMSDEEIVEEALVVLREMYGDVPAPLDALVPRWTLDPLFRGSYSNWPLGALDQHHSNLGQPLGGAQSWLHFSGEATSADSFGYVQGAWDQGIRTAEAIVACFAGDCPDATVYEAVTTCEQDETTMSRRSVRGAGGRKRGGAPRRHAILPQKQKEKKN